MSSKKANRSPRQRRSVLRAAWDLRCQAVSLRNRDRWARCGQHGELRGRARRFVWTRFRDVRLHYGRYANSRRLRSSSATCRAEPCCAAECCPSNDLRQSDTGNFLRRPADPRCHHSSRGSSRSGHNRNNRNTLVSRNSTLCHSRSRTARPRSLQAATRQISKRARISCDPPSPSLLGIQLRPPSTDTSSALAQAAPSNTNPGLRRNLPGSDPGAQPGRRHICRSMGSNVAALTCPPPSVATRPWRCEPDRRP